MKFKIIRKERGYTLQFVADKLGVSVKTLMRIESGERIPKADMLYRLASIYGCKVDDFFGEVDPTLAPGQRWRAPGASTPSAV